jgi:hypothetical protein
VGADVCRLLCVRLLERRDIEAARRHEQAIFCSFSPYISS